MSVVNRKPHERRRSGLWLHAGSALCALLPAFVFTACNIFAGFDSFSAKPKAPPAAPGTESDKTEAGNDAGSGRARTGSVDVQSRLPDGAATPTPVPSQRNTTP